jgi:cytochrome c oxidase subunit 2
MTRTFRPRQLAAAAFPAAMTVLLAACSNDQYPNSTFTSLTEFNRDLTSIWNTMMFWGTLVFVLTEVLLIYTIYRFRRRPGGPEPVQTHGNTKLELTWTVLPAVVLVFIAVPSVKSIWRFQTGAPANALQVDVIGHQWWWEFRYPEQNIITANELYLPIGRPVNFTLRSADVIHSFWVPQLGGKRDLMRNRTNTLWFTPDSLGPQAFNGSCNEFCGASHANMRFRAYVVNSGDFDLWVAGQQANAAFPPAAPAADSGAAPATPVANQAVAATPPAATGYVFPQDQLPEHVIPDTPLPAGLAFDDNLLATGDPQRGMTAFVSCIGCHTVRGNAMARGVIGPDLTHVGSRHTIGAGIFPNDDRHLARWIKNARRMKPMALGAASMPTLGEGEIDPLTKATVTRSLGGLSDQQIADIVAYLRSLK